MALYERDEVPDCPSCGGRSFRRESMFGAALPPPAPRPRDAVPPPWLDETRAALTIPGDYLAYEGDGDRAIAAQLKAGWTRVGRSLSADVRLDDPTVSRRHALVYRDEDGAKVLDDRSLNGVFRNGERIELSELLDGDTLTVGRFSLHVITLADASVTEPRRAAGAGR